VTRALKAAALAAALVAPLTFGAAAQAATMVFNAPMNGASEVPPKTTSGKGDATVALDTTTKTIEYTVTFSGLTGPATMAHIHGPAAVGSNAGVVVPLGNNPTSPIKGTATLNNQQMADLEAGKYYVNVHTSANPGGEIRGQLMPTK
jgi:hypothetical protein